MKPDSEVLRNLGLHQNLVAIMQRCLEFYAAANKCNINICILAANRTAIKLQKRSMLDEPAESPRRIFKPDILETKSIKDSIRSPFLGEYTLRAIQELNQAHRQDDASHTPHDSFFRKYSAPLVYAKSDMRKVRSSSLQEKSNSSTFYEFNNVSLQYHLGHFRYLHQQGIFTIEAISIKKNKIVITYSEMNEPDSAADIRLAKYCKVRQGKATITLDEAQASCLSQEFPQNFSSSSTVELADVFFKSAFFKKYKNILYVELFDGQGMPLRTLGIQKKDSYGRVISESAFMSDIDVHKCCVSDNLPPSPVMHFNHIGFDPDLKPAFDSAVLQEYERLKAYLDEYHPDFSITFDWQGFRYQLFNCQEMGSISARELVLFLFINFVLERDHQGFINWILQHGPTNLMPLEPASEEFMQQLQQPFATADLKFPAVRPDTTILLLASREEHTLQVFRGMEILALYARLEDLERSTLHQHWQLQIQAYLQDGNPNVWDIKRHMLMNTKKLPTHSNLCSSARQNVPRFYKPERSNSGRLAIDVEALDTELDGWTRISK